MTQLPHGGIDLSSIARREQQAQAAIQHHIEQVEIAIYSQLVACSEIDKPDTYRQFAKIAINAAPYLLEAKGVVEVKPRQETAGQTTDGQ